MLTVCTNPITLLLCSWVVLSLGQGDCQPSHNAALRFSPRLAQTVVMRLTAGARLLMTCNFRRYRRARAPDCYALQVPGRNGHRQSSFEGIG